MRISLPRSVYVYLLSLLLSPPLLPQRPAVCSDQFLLTAVRAIDRACNDVSCDFSKLREIDAIPRADLLTALRDPNLRPVHLFFPADQSALERSFDWLTIKKDQLDTLRAVSNSGGRVFILGKASSTGFPGTRGDDHNRRLSIARMTAVRDYLQRDLGIACDFKGGFFGREIFQLSLSDGRLLNVEPRDFREDEIILNQAVHVFVYPCPERL